MRQYRQGSAFYKCFIPLQEDAILKIMEITVKLPDDLTQHPNPGREALEALVIEGYRSGTFSHYQASQRLGISRLEFDGFLKSHHVNEYAYDLEDFEQDERTLQELKNKDFLRE